MGDKRKSNILTGAYPAPDIPLIDLYSFVIRDWQSWLDEIALINTDTRQQFTYREALETIEKVAGDLSRCGVRGRDVVSCWCSNCPELAITTLAAWKIGATVAMIGSSLTADEGKLSITKVRSAFLFVGSNIKQKAIKAFGTSQLQNLFKVGNCEFIGLSRRPGSAVPNDVPHKIAMNDTCLILFSSGTTGLPKAVELTHVNMITALELASAKTLGRTLPTGLVFLPMTHFYGLASTLKYLNDGSKTLIMSRFDLEKYIKLASENQLMAMALVPPVAVMLCNNPEVVRKYDLSSLMYVFSSGASLSLKTIQKIKELLPGIILAVAQGYGMTETTGAVTRSNENTPEGSVGSVISGMELRIVDVDSGRTCGPHEKGELTVRGPTIMKGYYGDPKATSEMIDANGWLHTGDIGYFDENESVFIVDRIKEMIKHKGQQVAPAELEALLLTHPEVLDVGVTGIPDEMMGELPIAFIVRKENSNTSEQQFQKFVAENVAPYKQLTGGVRFVSSIPKSPTGKILRRVLKDSLNKSRL